jgi:hypothetical protein
MERRSIQRHQLQLWSLLGPLVERELDTKLRGQRYPLSGAILRTSRKRFFCACVYFNKQDSSPFSRGIARYDVALGSFGGGQDVVSRTMVGDRTWFVGDNLSLSNGGTYFATVWAVDHVGLEVIHRVDESISPFLDHGRQQCNHDRQHAPRTRLCLRRPRCIFCVPE